MQPARLNDVLSVAAARLKLVDEHFTEFKAAAGDAHRHYIRFVRSMLRAKEIGDRLKLLGADVGSDNIAQTEADLARAAATAVGGGFLAPDDPVLAGIPLPA